MLPHELLVCLCVWDAGWGVGITSKYWYGICMVYLVQLPFEQCVSQALAIVIKSLFKHNCSSELPELRMQI